VQENKSSRAFLIVSVCLGVVAMVLSFAYLQGKTGSESGVEVAILVAAHDIRANTALSQEKDLAELKIPDKFVELRRRALNPQYRTKYDGQRVNRDILAGTPIFDADLVASADLDLTGDSRAMSIPVRGANALSGLLAPGDYVKLLVTRPTMHARLAQPGEADPTSGGPGGGSIPGVAVQGWETSTIEPLPLRVLAVGSRMTRPGRQVTLADQYSSAKENEATQTVTLEVTEAQAKNIQEQMGGGQFPVTLILCPPQKPAATVTPAAPVTPAATTPSK
jgi:Flp pilus assembly protein CpaB